MVSLITTPKIQLSLALLLIAAFAFFHQPSIQTTGLFILSISSALISDLIFVKIRKINFIFPSAALVSGLIIGLLVDPSSRWYEVVATSILAISIKDFLRVNGRHIFNPAAAGLFLATVLFQRPVSWWGVSSSPLLILLTPALVSIVNMRRWRIIVSFLLIYALLISLTTSLTIEILTTNLLDPTVLFFALVMAPEPMTTPHKAGRQIIFGSLIALMAILFSLLEFTFLGNPLISALLLGNILFFYRK